MQNFIYPDHMKLTSYFALLIALWIISPANIMGQDNFNEKDLGNLRYYAEANAKLPKADPKEKRVVFMGNSITEGWIRTDPGFFRGKPYINRGISGQTTDQMLIRFRQDVIDLHPSVVVLLAGTNDIAENRGPTSLEAIFENIVSMSELAQLHDIRVVLCAVLPVYDYPWRPGLQPADKIVALNKMISGYCSEHKIPFVDYHHAMADDRNGLPYKYAEDGVHPNLTGYQCMEPLVEAGITKAMKK